MKLFHYDSKLMQILMFIGDLMILNVLYVLCCLPIVTIGAAQAGLYSGVRVLNDPEDDSSAAGAFFKGFKNGFLKVTVAWGLMAVLSAVMVVVWWLCVNIEHADLGMAPTWMAVVGICIAAVFQSLVTVFHSRFDCKPLQLIRNAWFLLVAHPLRSLALSILIWLPFVLFLVRTYFFMTTAPLWLMLYYAVAALFGDLMMRKPFKTLIDHFNETNAQQAQEPIEAEAEVVESEE